MINLKPNTVLQLKMNDNAANPFVASLNGTPIQMVDEPYFDAEGDWDFSDPSWSLNNNRARFTAPSTGWFILPQNIGAVSGTKYLLCYTIAAMVGSVACRPFIGGQIGVNRNTVGTYVEVITAGSANNLLEFKCYSASGNSLDIDNVFVIDLDAYPATGVFSDVTGNPWTNAHSVAGKIGLGLSLDGIDDLIEVWEEGSCQFPNNDDDFSFWIWIKRGRTGVIEILFDKRDSGLDGWLLYIYSADKLAFRLNNVIVSNGSITITDTNWHLIMVVVHRATTAQIYIDNVADGSPLDVSNQPMSIVNNLMIGVMYDKTSYNFQGSLDAGGIVNKALSAEERALIWNNGYGTESLVSVARPLVNASLVSGRKGLICI